VQSRGSLDSPKQSASLLALEPLHDLEHESDELLRAVRRAVHDGAAPPPSSPTAPRGACACQQRTCLPSHRLAPLTKTSLCREKTQDSRTQLQRTPVLGCSRRISHGAPAPIDLLTVMPPYPGGFLQCRAGSQALPGLVWAGRRSGAGRRSVGTRRYFGRMRSDSRSV
jgi:hypothetical protein